jgi:hypothetical protein
MTNQIATGIARSTALKLPLGGNTTEFLDALDSNPAPRTNVDGHTFRLSLPTGKLASASATRPGAKQSVEQVETAAKTFVIKCWKDYAKAYPEAFATQANHANATPNLVFIRTQAEFDKNFGSSSDTLDMIAFVNQSDPMLVYVHSKNLAKYANQFGPNYVKTNLSHELIHSLTNGLNVRMSNDSSGELTSDGALKKNLASRFYFDDRKLPGIKSSFSVQELITEFAAEHFASKVTGIQSFSVSYTPVRATGKKLLQLVSEGTFKKAAFENNPVAYRRVVAAATKLRAQNVKSNILANRSEDITEMRAAQAAAPFSKRLTAATVEKLQIRYIRERRLYVNLKENFPNEIKNFDFKFFKAVDANLDGRGSFYHPDLGDAGLRELAVSIKAVWPSLR